MLARLIARGNDFSCMAGGAPARPGGLGSRGGRLYKRRPRLLQCSNTDLISQPTTNPMTQIDASLAGEALPRARRNASATSFWLLTLGSIGVVYGDIGTSPLYALREAVVAAVGADGAPTREAVLGVLSLILWALIVVVTLKYVVILLRADNNGEGGTLALMALAQRAHRQERRRRRAARHHQRRAVLRRRGDHAGAVGAVRGRRPEDRDAGVRALRRAAHRRHPDRAVRRAVARHREGRGLLRPDHAGLVRRHRASPASGTSRPIRACWLRSIRSTASRFLLEPRHDRPGHARRGVPRRHRRRGALRRPRPFRPQADPGRLARGGAAGAGAQLSRAGRAGARQSEGDRESVLPAVSRTGRCCRWCCSPPPRP